MNSTATYGAARCKPNGRERRSFRPPSLAGNYPGLSALGMAQFLSRTARESPESADGVGRGHIGGPFARTRADSESEFVHGTGTVRKGWGAQEQRLKGRLPREGKIEGTGRRGRSEYDRRV